MGKTHSKPLAARHGRGTAWARHSMCESAFNVLVSLAINNIFLFFNYDIFVKLQLGSHPVAVVQYTSTRKQYTERHETNNTENNTKSFGRVRAVPRLCELYPGIYLPYN
jgi:hypothetical protein